jgi:hypothetical protein
MVFEGNVDYRRMNLETLSMALNVMCWVDVLDILY